MDKAIWTVRTAKLCPKCIKKMEAEYIVYLTHEQQRNRMKDITRLLRPLPRGKFHASDAPVHHEWQDTMEEGAG